MANIFSWKGQTNIEYMTCVKKTLTFEDGEGPDIIVDDMGIFSEIIHIGVDVEAYFEQNKEFPNLEDMGWFTFVGRYKYG